MIGVAIIEDYEGLRMGLEKEINISPGLRCVGSYGSFEQAESALSRSVAPIKPDVILLDLKLPGMDGPEAVKALKQRWPLVKVLVYSGSDHEKTILECISAGADGYLLKKYSRSQIADGIKSVYEGTAALCPRASEVLIEHYRQRSTLLSKLSPIETEILIRIGERGESYKEVADELKISINTLKWHAKRILEKSFASSMGRASYLRKQAV